MHALRHHPREWSLKTWLLVAGGFAVAAVLVVVGVAQPPTERLLSNAHVTAVNDLTQSFDIHYPMVHNEKVDEQLRSFARAQTNEFVEKIKDKQYDPRNKLTLTYSVAHHGERMLSVMFTKTEEVVGQSLSAQYHQVYDIVSGRMLAISDLFRQDVDARGVLANILYDYFRQNTTAQLSPDQQLKLLDFSFDTVQGFAMYEDSLVLFMNPKNIAAKDAVEAVQLKKSVIASIVKPEYTGKDVAKVADVQPESTYVINEMPKRSAPNAGSGKRLALTFDDGPGVHTGRLLDTLAKYRSSATFYVLGHLAQPYAGQLQRMVQSGHEIGNHTWLHANLTMTSGAEFHHQVGDTQMAIQQATGGYIPRTLRPPYGATNSVVTTGAAEYGLHTILWNVDTNDWQTKNSQAVYDQIMGGAGDGRVILLHDIYGSSVDAAVRAIPDLLAQGYQLVTVSELYGY